MRGVLIFLAQPISVELGQGHLRTHRSEEHTSELQSQSNLVCRLLLEKKTTTPILERLGVLAPIERAAHAKLYGMTVVAPSGAAMSGRFASNHDHAPPTPYSVAGSRAIFDMMLLRAAADRKSTRLNSSHSQISYAVFC